MQQPAKHGKKEPAKADPAKAERRLALPEVLDWMVEDGVVTAETAEVLRKERRYYRGTENPLVIIAARTWMISGSSPASIWRSA